MQVVVSNSLIVTSIFITLLVIQILILIGTRKFLDKRIRLHRIVHWLFICTIFLCIDYIFMVNSPDVQFANVVLHLNFIIFDLIIFFFYTLVSIFIGRPNLKTKGTIAVAIVQTVDIVNLIISIFTGSMYRSVENYDGEEIYYSYETGPLFLPLFIMTISVIFVIIFLLLKKAVTAPAGFGRQYFIVAMITVAVGSSNAIFTAIGLIYDFSPAIVTIGMLFADHYAWFIVPNIFQRESRARVIGEANDGIIIYDFNGVCSDINDTAKPFFGDDFVEASKKVDEWVEKHEIDLSKESQFSYVATHLPGEPHFRVSVKPYTDGTKRNIYAGTYIRIHDRTEEDLREAQEYYNATHDLLTGFLNREAFFEEAKKFLEDCPRLNHYLVCSNISNFKLYNNSFGIEAGNTLLQNIADRLQKKLREYNLISRVEGDRFCILMPKKYFDERDFKRAYTEALTISGNEQYALNFYLGVCEIKDLDAPIPVMYNRALMAAQSIKDHADQYTCFYDEKIAERILETQNKVEEIRIALDNDEFVFYIQPQVTSEGKVVGGEALARWNHPQKGVVSPYSFIGLMEEHGLIEQLDFKIWDMVCRKLQEWKQQGITDQYISVNISAKDFYYMNIYEIFMGLTAKYDIDRDKLRLEITESAVMQDEKTQIGLIDKLCSAGFIVEIDDFGSGYSSLNMLNKLHVDVLKLDMGFLHQSDEDERTKTILENIMNMAKGLNMKTIAEGVETQDQADFLNSIGCDLFQGYLYSPPVSVEEYESRFIKESESF